MKPALIFDLDGTLIDSLPDIASAANALLARHDLPPRPVESYAHFVGLGERIFIERLITATALPDADVDTYLPEFLDHYARATKQTRLMPGVKEVLDWAKANGITLGLVTNKPARPLASVLEKTGLTDCFECVVAGDALPTRKPDAAPLLYAMQQLNATRCVYVGDTIFDAETAQNAGQPFALYTKGIRVTPLSEIPYDAKFDTFDALPALYKELSSKVYGI